VSGDGEERAARRPAAGAAPASGAPDEELPLADLTAGEPSPLEDLGAPWEGTAPGSPLPDLAGDPVGGVTERDGAAGDVRTDEATVIASSDEEWAPAVPLLDDLASPTDRGTTPDDAGADWAPLPDLADRRPRPERARRGRGRAGDAMSRRGRARVDADASSVTDAGTAPGGASSAPTDPGATIASGPGSAAGIETAPGADPAAPSPRDDGLPPGALGAGAAGGGLGLFAGGDAGGTAASAPGERPPRRKGRRRRRRGGDDDAVGGTAADAATEAERPLTAEERLQHALTLAYRHLSKRDRTVSEVRAHLEKREIDETSIAGALRELTEFGYVDDERYATRFVEDKRRLEGWGHLRIEQGLRRTGIPREVADRALAEDPLRGDEDELAVEALEQRLGGRGLEDDRARQKALRLLATKGYALDTSYAAVRTYERRCAERDDG
jgi:regulatory protein